MTTVSDVVMFGMTLEEMTAFFQTNIMPVVVVIATVLSYVVVIFRTLGSLANNTKKTVSGITSGFNAATDNMKQCVARGLGNSLVFVKQTRGVLEEVETTLTAFKEEFRQQSAVMQAQKQFFVDYIEMQKLSVESNVTLNAGTKKVMLARLTEMSKALADTTISTQWAAIEHADEGMGAISLNIETIDKALADTEELLENLQNVDKPLEDGGEAKEVGEIESNSQAKV